MCGRATTEFSYKLLKNRQSSTMLKYSSRLLRSHTVKFASASTSSSSSSAAAGEVRYAGHEEARFRYIAERSSKFVSEVLKPRVTVLNKGSVTMLLPFRQDFIGNPLIPCLHGGIAASMLDHVSGICAWSVLDDALKSVSTADLRVDYLNPAPCEDLHFEATTVHLSNKLVRVDSTCWNYNRTKKIAIGRGLFNIYFKKEEDVERANGLYAADAAKQQQQQQQQDQK